MSQPERRHATGKRFDPRLLLVAAFLLGVLLTAGVAGVLAGTSGGSSSEPGQAVDTPGPRPTARGTTPSPSDATPSEQPSPSPPSVGENEQRAQMTKPLAQLAPGDRVVYNMNACRFRAWVGKRQDVALIACTGGEPFQVRTVYLVPVELGGD